MWNFKREAYKICNTSAIPTIACSAIASSGGEGVTEFVIQLDKPLGGIVVMDFNAQGVVDKLEIIHNGIKKATSGMTVANSGPFDDLYGSPTVPTDAQANATDQFIGTSKGVIPNRDSVFLSETGITDVVRTKQQLIWFVYSELDYNTSNSVIVRVTGPAGTAWDLIRLCTDQTPSSLPQPSELIEVQGVGPDIQNNTNDCLISMSGVTNTMYLDTSGLIIQLGDHLYTTNATNSPVSDGWYIIDDRGVNKRVLIDVGTGEVIEIKSC